MRLALVTADHPQVNAEDFDRPFHNRALAAAEFAVSHPNWSDPSIDWAVFDLVVIRTTWDYTERLQEFLAWLERVEPLGTVHNPPPLIRWNMDKSYLFDLEAQGVPIVPTIISAELDEVASALESKESKEVVVKPVVSASSRNTGRFVRDDPAAVALAAKILAAGNTVMLQPAVESVQNHGETALLLFGGDFSHAIRKGPLLDLGGGLLGGTYQEEISRWDPSPAERDVAAAASEASRSLAAEQGWTEPDTPLLYGRYDVVTLDDGSSALLEAELFEPSLFLNMDPDAADRFASACKMAVDS